MFIQEIIGAFTGQNRRDKRAAVATGTILGLLGGTVIGGALGLLFAPKPGEELREEIGDAAVSGYNTVKGKAAEVGEKVSSKVSETYSQFKDDMSETAREARKKARQARRHARKVGETVEEAAEDVGEEVEEAVEDVKA